MSRGSTEPTSAESGAQPSDSANAYAKRHEPTGLLLAANAIQQMEDGMARHAECWRALPTSSAAITADTLPDGGLCVAVRFPQCALRHRGPARLEQGDEIVMEPDVTTV